MLNLPELLRRELGRRSWKGETIALSGNTDCYQLLEASYRLTRRCLEVCLEPQSSEAVAERNARWHVLVNTTIEVEA